MKKLILIIFLISTSYVFAQSKLPKCQGSDFTKYNNCFGEFISSDGIKYVGEFKNGKQHGQGTITYANGDKYVGEYKDGKRHGRGTFTRANGDEYVGEWKDDKRHGQGTSTYANGQKYVGKYKDGQRHGQGTYTWSAGPFKGDKYVGEYKEGKYHGQATYTFANGDKYVGEYKDGKRHGRGTYTFSDGGVLKGTFADGKFVDKVGSGKKIDIYDPKNQFYYDDNFRIFSQAVSLTCSPQAMGKSKLLNLSDDVITNCDPSNGLNCRILGPTIRLCIYGTQ